MSKPTICFRSCKLLVTQLLRNARYSDLASAELEMTVHMLIQIDKLVQLLESPVFTCKSHSMILSPSLTHTRSSASAT